ncbi:MAG: acyl-CoA dehydrogenase, partial [SAR202 cluster bacterium]|nr:acyl-CoA dehydrogenase [SAR202 cluster bacterium]
IKNQDIQDNIVDIFIESEITRLFNLRNYWLAHANKQRTYEGPQSSFYRKTSALRIAEKILDILGPYAITNDEKWGLYDGAIELQHRGAIVGLHPGGTTDIQRVIMSRRIGIGREIKEQAGTLS